jgi:hypothetical protein
LFSRESASARALGSALRTTISAQANQPLSTLETNGVIGFVPSGSVVSTSPVASSYQLKYMPLGS